MNPRKGAETCPADASSCCRLSATPIKAMNPRKGAETRVRVADQFPGAEVYILNDRAYQSHESP